MELQKKLGHRLPKAEL